MAIDYPSSLDNFTNPQSDDKLDNPPHATQHSDINDAVEALEGKVGVDNSTDTVSLDSKVRKNEQNIILNAFRIAIQNSLSIFNMIDMFVDEYEDETGIDGATSENEQYNSTDDYYYNLAENELETFTLESYDQWMGDEGGTDKWLAQSFTLDEATTISKVAMKMATRVGSPSGGITLRIETDDTGLPSGTLVNANATKNVNPTDNQWSDWEFDTPFSISSGYYWIVLTCSAQSTNNRWKIRAKSGGGYADGIVAYSTNFGSSWATFGDDLPFKVYGGSANMTLISESQTAETEPDEARIVILEEDISEITLNTDLKAYISKDGGSTWVQATLADEGDFDTTKRILVGTADLTVSGVGSGTNIEYKLTSHNDKTLKIHGTSVAWN